MTGVELIAVERQRQIDEEGWTIENDRLEHDVGDLACAAVCYASAYVGEEVRFISRCSSSIGGYDPWPFDRKWDKRDKHDKKRCLVIAGALIAAELDRLQVEDS